MKCEDIKVDLCFRCNGGESVCWAEYWFEKLSKSNKEEVKDIIVYYVKYMGLNLKYIEAVINNLLPKYVPLLNTIMLLK